MLDPMAVYNAAIFGEIQRPVREYISNAVSTARGALTAAADQFIGLMSPIYSSAYTDTAARVAQGLARKISTFATGDHIRPLTTMTQIQLAPPVMIPYIMAEPTIREMYLNKEIDGYSDVYVDDEGGRTGNLQHRYQAVMDGVVTNGSDGTMRFTHWLTDNPLVTEPLKIEEKAAIITTWESCRQIMMAEKQRDVTNIWSGFR